MTVDKDQDCVLEVGHVSLLTTLPNAVKLLELLRGAEVVQYDYSSQSYKHVTRNDHLASLKLITPSARAAIELGK